MYLFLGGFGKEWRLMCLFLFYFQVFIKNLSSLTPTQVNNKIIPKSLTALSHNDLITIVDRNFRFEFPPTSRFFPVQPPIVKSPKTPKSPMVSDRFGDVYCVHVYCLYHYYTIQNVRLMNSFVCKYLKWLYCVAS